MWSQIWAKFGAQSFGPQIWGPDLGFQIGLNLEPKAARPKYRYCAGSAALGPKSGPKSGPKIGSQIWGPLFQGPKKWGPYFGAQFGAPT